MKGERHIRRARSWGPGPLHAAAPRRLAAAAALAFIAMLVVSAAGGLLLFAPAAGAWRETLADPYVWRVARFTFWQAALSTLLSLLFALPVARALARRAAFPGRGLLIRLFSLPLALPQLVAVMGALSLWGNNGWLARLAHVLGLPAPPSIYGLGGVVLVHVFFNMPLAVRMLSAALERQPGEYWRLAAQLDMPPAAIWRRIEWPALRAVLPGAALLIFMLCAASFTVVLTLGGGPAATTLEVAIYQALRFDFDPPRAMILALAQMSMTALLFLLLRRFARPPDIAAGLDRPFPHPAAARLGARLHDAFWLLAGALFVAAPLAGVVSAGLAADLPRILAGPELRAALRVSLELAFASAGLALALAWGMLLPLRERRARVLAGAGDLAASLVLAVPPVVLGAGWFIILHRLGRAESLAPPLVAAVNALMALPFAWRTLRPAFVEAEGRYGRLCAALGVSGLARLRLVDWPLLRRPLGLAAALALALSIGDMGAIALFGSQSFRTLPWLLYQRLGSYRTADAAGLALILLVFILLLMALAEHLAKERRPA